MGKFRRWFESVIDLPVVRQSHSYDCGAAALRAVCQYWGVGPDQEEDFIRALDTNSKDGTSPQSICSTARRFGLAVHQKERMSLDELKHFLDQHKPVIVAVQAWGDDQSYGDNDSGHWVVAIGYDDDRIYFEDPSLRNERRGHMPHDEFVRRWHDVDKDHKVWEQLGIVIWKEDKPKEEKRLTRSSKIE